MVQKSIEYTEPRVQLLLDGHIPKGVWGLKGSGWRGALCCVPEQLISNLIYAYEKVISLPSFNSSIPANVGHSGRQHRCQVS